MPPPRMISKTQIEILLSFLDTHRDSGVLQRISDLDSQKEVKKLWEELASQLNTVKDGAQKTGVMWRRYWNEKKYAVRKKASEIQRSINAGKETRFVMTSEEHKILNLIGCLSGKKDRSANEPVQEGDFSVFDPLDQSSYDDDSLPEQKPVEQQESKPKIADLNGSPANDDKTSIVATMCTTGCECDEGFTPGCSENLPQIDPLAVTEFLMTFPDYNKEETRALWRQPHELINDSIGYVQIKKDDACTVKCVVATKTTANHCTIAYDEASCNVLSASCDCLKPRCSHELAALIWLSRHKTGPGTYWLQPMVERDVKSMKISAIFGYPEKNDLPKKSNILKEFVRLCQESNNFTPTLMKYFHEDHRTKASLHKLMCQFKRSYSLDADTFLYFCRASLNDKDCEIETPEGADALEVKQELEYGRITDVLLHAVSRAKADEVDDLVEKITLPDAEETAEINADIIESLEKSMQVKIKKCGMLISNTSPIFAASPYGITDGHVIHVKYIEEKANEYSGKTLALKNNACMHLQMFLAKKQNACFCAVHKNHRIDITIVKYDQAFMDVLLKKATTFWKTHIFKAINMENAD